MEHAICEPAGKVAHVVTNGPTIAASLAMLMNQAEWFGERREIVHKTEQEISLPASFI
jgi:hypothetical protein